MILKINDRFRNRKIDFFNNFKIDMKYDAIGSTFSLDYFFDPNNQEHKEFSCIGHYHLCTLEDNGELIMTGYITSIRFVDKAKTSLVRIAGYSLTGVLEDCEIPPSVYPLQSDGLNLREIAEKFVKPFGIKIIIEAAAAAAMEEVFETTDAKETQSVKSYLAELASQKNIIMTHNEKGNLVFTKASSTQVPIFDFTDNTIIPAVEFDFEFNGQGIHSEITAFAQADIDETEQTSENTVKNPWCPIVYRPHVVVQSSRGVEADTERAAKNALQQELKNINVTVSIDRWDLNGKIVRPGKIITITNPRIYMYNKTPWIIDSVSLQGDAENKLAILLCVPKEVYTGETPVYPFKGINTHYNG